MGNVPGSFLRIKKRGTKLVKLLIARALQQMDNDSTLHHLRMHLLLVPVTQVVFWDGFGVQCRRVRVKPTAIVLMSKLQGLLVEWKQRYLQLQHQSRELVFF